MSDDKPLRHTYPQTEEEFLTLLREVIHPTYTGMDSGYELTADSMWKAALLAFNYAASVNGTTGFQASYASLRLLGELRNIDGPYAIVDADHMLYPQYDIRAKVEGWLEEWTPWAAEEAKKKLKEHGDWAAPQVVGHWHHLASLHVEEEAQ